MKTETTDHRYESSGVGPTAGCQHAETNIQTPIPLSASESRRLPHQSSFFQGKSSVITQLHKHPISLPPPVLKKNALAETLS